MKMKTEYLNKLFMPFGISGNIYLLGALGQGLGPLLLTPILTRRLSIEEFGEITFVTAFASILGIFFSFGLPIVISRTYVLDVKSRKSINNWFNKIIILYILISIFLSFINFNFIYLIILAISLNFSCLQLILPFARAKNKATSFALISIIGTILPSAFVIFNSLNDVLITNLSALQIGAIVSSIISFLLIRSKQVSGSNLEKYSIKSSLKSSYPILPHMFAMMALLNIDKVIFGQQLDKSDSGFIQVIMLIAMAPIMILSALNHAWLNQILLQLKANYSKALSALNQTILNLTVLTGLVAFISYLLHKKLIELLNPNIVSSNSITRTVVLGFMCSFIYVIYLANTHLLTWQNRFWILGFTTPISVFAQSFVIYLTIEQLNYLSAPLGLGCALTLQIFLLRLSRQNTKTQKAITPVVQLVPVMAFWFTALFFLYF